MKRFFAVTAISALLGLAATAAPTSAPKDCCAKTTKAKAADCCKPGADCCKPGADCCKAEVGQAKTKSDGTVASASCCEKTVDQGKTSTNDCCQPGAACCVPGAACCK
jgi:hypothetical protein